MKNRFSKILLIILCLTVFLLSGCELLESELEDEDVNVTQAVNDTTDMPQSADKPTDTESSNTEPTNTKEERKLTFRNEKLQNQHFEKHGSEVECSSIEEYVAKANAVVNNPNALSKKQTKDGDADTVYFIEATNEFVVVSSDGYLRTYFICSGKKYYDRQ